MSSFNSVTIQALRKTSSLSKPLRTLLLSLAVSDLAVGLLVQPFYIVLLVKWLHKNTENSPSCPLYTAFVLICHLCSCASFLGVMALSADRFLAIHLHLRYQELVTQKRVVSAVVSLWVLSVIFSLFVLWVSPSFATTVHTTICVACLSVSLMFYCKIYFAVRRHRNQIQVLQVAQDVEMAANLASRIKSAVGTVYVYLVFLICYLPLAGTFAATVTSDINTTIKISLFSSYTLVYLNSSLNPVIYCWKMRHIRRAIMAVLRNVFPSQS